MVFLILQLYEFLKMLKNTEIAQNFPQNLPQKLPLFDLLYKRQKLRQKHLGVSYTPFGF